VLVSSLLYFTWRPTRFVNYGELLPPVALADVVIQRADGGQFRFSTLRGKWVMLTVDSGRCDAYCRTKLQHMRQVRLTQGADLERIERVWLVVDRVVPDASIEQEYAGTQRVVLASAQFLAVLPAPRAASDHIYLIDPLGNLMMRFPAQADPNRMKKDLAKLLKLSSGWKQGK
jgi:cytochrome oxidase Cu insertion factor (SCO1/SenC/PrrC family)